MAIGLRCLKTMRPPAPGAAGLLDGRHLCTNGKDGIGYKQIDQLSRVLQVKQASIV